jgi:hypothetical protein
MPRNLLLVGVLSQKLKKFLAVTTGDEKKSFCYATETCLATVVAKTKKSLELGLISRFSKTPGAP